MLVHKLTDFLFLGTPILLLLSQTVCDKAAHVKKTKEEITHEFLRLFQFRHMSDISSRSYCSREASFVIGVRIRTSTHLNQTYPSVNVIEFICSDRMTFKMTQAPPFELGKNIGSWGEVKECAHGFVTGMMLHLQYIESTVSSLEESNKDQKYFKYAEKGFNVYSVWKNRYITGISLYCSDDIDSENNPFLSLGKKTENGLKLVCLDYRMMTGMEVYKEAIGTYDGERLIPLNIKMTCKRLTHPLQRCVPDMRWEKIRPSRCFVSPAINSVSNFTLTNSTKLNITCVLNYAVGTSLNQEITNLKEILYAYESLYLDSLESLGYIILMLFRSPLFIKSWAQTQQLQMNDYKKITLIAPTEFIRLRNNTESLKFYDIPKTLSLERFLKNQRNVSSGVWKQSLANETNEVQHDFVVHQLIGYCSIYKFYFPVLKHEYQQYKDVKIAGISSRIILQSYF